MARKKTKPLLPESMAERVARKFGGVPALAVALKKVRRKRHLSAIYRWNLPRKRGGSEGLIPTAMIRNVVLAARKSGVKLTCRDFCVCDPRDV